jgi:adenylate cyclase
LIKETVKKVGPGNFNSWILGLLNKPCEEERIFMFIDLKSSTTIAEKLGHKKFSHLVQDLFNDMAIVDNYDGEIYQYMGDGAIISWSLKNGLKQNKFLQAFFVFEKLIQKKHRYYKRKYNLTPQFKAGVHVGKVMVLQVGKIRRDISYNGDTMNTAARIESKCNELKSKLLISATLYNLITNKKRFIFKSVGKIELRGKRKAVEIYRVKTK